MIYADDVATRCWLAGYGEKLDVYGDEKWISTFCIAHLINSEYLDLKVPSAAFESREQMQSYIESVLSHETLGKY